VAHVKDNTDKGFWGKPEGKTAWNTAGYATTYDAKTK